MDINVRLYGPAKQYLELDDFTLVVNDGATVLAALDELGLMSGDLAELLPTCGVAIGDDMVTRDHVLQPGDQLSVLPPVNGG
jgi:molybdopterin converting factor small subunit